MHVLTSFQLCSTTIVSSLGTASPDSQSGIRGLAYESGGGIAPIFSTISCAQTTASSSELLASLFAPCRPVQATSPQANSPGSAVSPSMPADIPPQK